MYVLGRERPANAYLAAHTNIAFVKVFWLIPPYALFTLAFGGSIVPKLNL